MLAMRFDFRNPPMAGTTVAERYAAALDMAEWADQQGALMIGVSEHHGADDEYLPSPLVMAAAFIARTTTTRINIASLIGPFHEPLRLAEDLAVLDHLSQGRLDVTISGGYVPAEFDMFGVPLGERPKRMEKLLRTLRQAWTGEPFEYDGRTVTVTPKPFREGGPALVMGGSSEAAARRAARIADGFAPTDGEFWAYYRDECEKLGKPDPGPGHNLRNVLTYLAEDVEQGWEELGSYFLHETNTYGAWAEAAGVANPYKRMPDVETLRKESDLYRILTPDEYAAELKATGDFAFVMMHPMVGGIPPERAWRAIRLFEHEVLPQLT